MTAGTGCLSRTVAAVGSGNYREAGDPQMVLHSSVDRRVAGCAVSGRPKLGDSSGCGVAADLGRRTAAAIRSCWVGRTERVEHRPMLAACRAGYQEVGRTEFRLCVATGEVDKSPTSAVGMWREAPDHYIHRSAPN